MGDAAFQKLLITILPQWQLNNLNWSNEVIFMLQDIPVMGVVMTRIQVFNNGNIGTDKRCQLFGNEGESPGSIALDSERNIYVTGYSNNVSVIDIVVCLK
ncbi:MAG: SBBP repeat-containing protein [Bacillus subtilis]|nr:SBBP repeat-containing protein [Bacillus subtilis]